MVPRVFTVDGQLIFLALRIKEKARKQYPFPGLIPFAAPCSPQATSNCEITTINYNKQNWHTKQANKIKQSIRTALSGSASMANVTSHDAATSLGDDLYLNMINQRFLQQLPYTSIKIDHILRVWREGKPKYQGITGKQLRKILVPLIQL